MSSTGFFMEQEDLFPEEDKESFSYVIKWWEKRRLRYNLIVGIIGLLLLLDYGIKLLDIYDVIAIAIFGIVCNVLYCLGYGIEFVLKHYFKSDVEFSGKRPFLFWSGAIATIIFMIVLTLLGELLR